MKNNFRLSLSFLLIAMSRTMLFYFSFAADTMLRCAFEALSMYLSRAVDLFFTALNDVVQVCMDTCSSAYDQWRSLLSQCIQTPGVRSHNARFQTQPFDWVGEPSRCNTPPEPVDQCALSLADLTFDLFAPTCELNFRALVATQDTLRQVVAHVHGNVCSAPEKASPTCPEGAEEAQVGPRQNPTSPRSEARRGDASLDSDQSLSHDGNCWNRSLSDSSTFSDASWEPHGAPHPTAHLPLIRSVSSSPLERSSSDHPAPYPASSLLDITSTRQRLTRGASSDDTHATSAPTQGLPSSPDPESSSDDDVHSDIGSYWHGW